MQTKEYHIKLPKHLSVRLEDQIIERYGYRARGGITLLILEAIEEKLNPTKSTKYKTEKNELARLVNCVSINHERVNSFKNLIGGDISIIANDLIDFAKNSDRNDISAANLMRKIRVISGRKDNRTIEKNIQMLIDYGFIKVVDTQGDKPYRYLITEKLLPAEKQKALIYDNDTLTEEEREVLGI